MNTKSPTAAHTPGPWTYQEVAGAYGWTVGRNEHGGADYVADVHKMTSKVIRDDAESEANACLIAVAPQLLAACEHARSAIIFGGNIDWNVLTEELQAAIQAAKGEA